MKRLMVLIVALVLISSVVGVVSATPINVGGMELVSSPINVGGMALAASKATGNAYGLHKNLDGQPVMLLSSPINVGGME
ncbi:hypothetical protein ACFLSW_01375 [Candidatus Bipolaricaulota bacterium]